MLEVAFAARRGAFAIDLAFASEGAAVTALFGRSGAGKSSAIEAVAGLLRPERGRIALGGRALFDAGKGIDIPPHRRRVGLVFQDARLFPHLGVRHNLTYGMERVTSGERVIAFDAVVEALGIGHLLDRRPATLSGGETQRVAIGRALLASPRILLMDEPLAALDGERRAELLPFISLVSHRFAIPILYVSHAVDEVLRLADRLVLIEAGRAVAAGPVEEVAARDDFARIAALTGVAEPFSVLAGTVIDHDEALMRTRVEVAAGVLAVGRLDAPSGARVRLRIGASDVILALAAPAGLSVRNVLPARVTGLGDVDGMVDVALDAGTVLRARITRDAAAELGLVRGKRLFALVKSAAIVPSAWTRPKPPRVDSPRGGA